MTSSLSKKIESMDEASVCIVAVAILQSNLIGRNCTCLIGRISRGGEILEEANALELRFAFLIR